MNKLSWNPRTLFCLDWFEFCCFEGQLLVFFMISGLIALRDKKYFTSWSEPNLGKYCFSPTLLSFAQVKVGLKTPCFEYAKLSFKGFGGTLFEIYWEFIETFNNNKNVQCKISTHDPIQEHSLWIKKFPDRLHTILKEYRWCYLSNRCFLWGFQIWNLFYPRKRSISFADIIIRVRNILNTHFFYKNTLYKNTEPHILPNLKIIFIAENVRKVRTFLFNIVRLKWPKYRHNQGNSAKKD